MMLDRMHPRTFHDEWGLTNWQVASLLGLSERTVVAYCASPGSASLRNPSPSVEKLTFIRHQAFLNERSFQAVSVVS
jgi:hypothetical protein